MEDVLFILIFSAVVFLIIFIKASFQYRKERKELKKIIELDERKKDKIDRHNKLIQKHKPTLVQKYKQLTYMDDYGNFKKEGFLKELDYFIRNTLFKNESYTNSNYEYEYNRILLLIENAVEEEPDIKVNNPFDFEKKCAEILNKNGWQAKATQKSADKGIDVIATKDDITVALQCKLYSKPVGLKAVQEAFSGKEYYNANYAGVVTNSTFTVAARQLAKSCNIYLLSPDSLKDLDKVING